LLRSEEFKDKFGGHLQFDQFTDRAIVSGGEVANESWTNISSWLSEGFYFERSPGSVRDFGRMVAMNNSTDILHEYVANLNWDNEDRFEHLFETLATESDYHRVLVRKWLVGGIARALQPGCSAGHMLVLHGAQGIGKSRFFQALAPVSDWFSDSSTFKFRGSNAARDEEMKLQGHWIVEVAELAGIMKSDFSDLKQFLTLQAPRIRRPYDADVVPLKRRCIFGGSTNIDAVVNDPTGSRRFGFLTLPEGHHIDVKWVKENRHQLWAQAKHYYDNGMKWWLEDAEVPAQVEDNAQYRTSHPWTNDIVEWAQGKSRFNTGDVLTHAVGKDKGQWTIADENSVRAILQAENWQKKRIKVRNGDNFTYPKGMWINPDTAIDASFTGVRWEPPKSEF
jgi:predicted P-loop ATPase